MQKQRRQSEEISEVKADDEVIMNSQIGPTTPRNNPTFTWQGERRERSTDEEEYRVLEYEIRNSLRNQYLHKANSVPDRDERNLDDDGKLGTLQ